jgi:hypothetical protein
MKTTTLGQRRRMLKLIESEMGAGFMKWFLALHKLRSSGKQEEYEKAIFDKYEHILGLDKKKKK